MDCKDNSKDKQLHKSTKSWVPKTPEKLLQRVTATDSCSTSKNGKHIECAKEDRQERELFYLAQVASFLYRMNLIQGNRHYSPWKGSVVDSVVAAYLSQNVSDQSSSNVLMELAAKYRNAGELPSDESHIEIDWARRRKNSLRKEKEGKNIKWDTLRRSNCRNGLPERNDHNMDIINWEAIRVEFTESFAEAIIGRGMQDKLAKRIQGFLNRLIRDHENLDLEWLNNVSPHKVQEFLLSIEGLGLKSVECIRLLALQQPAFPVDTNVSRVVVRLGWVPVQTFSSEPLHLLTKYPAPNFIHEYLWPRLSDLSEQILYELHSQMITFGKVFCTKKNPNCKACPMRGECKHYASESASATLPDIEDFPFNVQVYLKNLDNYKENMLGADVDESKALVAFSPPIASIPMRLRTKQVFELPDSHPVLDGIDKRVFDDRCPYMLAVWKPDTSNNNQEDNPQTVRGTLLIPCRTAVGGRFPLNGTHFQFNEVFADNESSEKPIKVSWKLIRDLKRRTLYFGTSLTRSLKDLSTREIQQVFWFGSVCFRGFNRKTRLPTPLADIFHPRPRSSRKEKRVTRQNRNGVN